MIQFDKPSDFIRAAAETDSILSQVIGKSEVLVCSGFQLSFNIDSGIVRFYVGDPVRAAKCFEQLYRWKFANEDGGWPVKRDKLKCENIEHLQECIRALGWRGEWLGADDDGKWRFCMNPEGFVDWWQSTGTVYTPDPHDQAALRDQLAVTSVVPSKPITPKRKIEQICVAGAKNTPDSLYALCSDGTVWMYFPRVGENPWAEIKPIPQPGGESE